ncbi:unnamed protein product [Phytophthora fragariaefolia]|uniref:Unnamed protein product n=1 Tax=Phytophthora fragariaefolia TaxID=1490495 RepID=A0A9W6TR19_9STRA|nr:unnamed protein product [Phytophthora fragariaefolia]
MWSEYPSSRSSTSQHFRVHHSCAVLNPDLYSKFPGSEPWAAANWPLWKTSSCLAPHVKREYNQAADYLTSKTLTLGKSCTVQDPEEFLQLERVPKIAEKLMKPKVVLLDGELPQDSERPSLPKGSVGDVADSQLAPLAQAGRVFAVLTRAKTKARTLPSPEVVENAPPDEEEPRRPMTTLEYQAERWRRIRVHQEQDTYLSEIKSFLKGYIGRFPPRRLRKISKVPTYSHSTREMFFIASLVQPEGVPEISWTSQGW